MISRKTKSLLVFFTILPVLLLGVLLYGIYTIKALSEETSILEQETESRSEEEVVAQKIRLSQSTHRESLEAFNNLVLTSGLTSGKLVSLINTIEKTGQDLGLETTITSVENLVDKNPKPGVPELINIQTEVIGSWSSALTFIKAVESLPHRVIIDNLNFYKESIAKDGKWHAEVSLTLYAFMP